VAATVNGITEPEVLDLLTRLVEKSLVVYEEDEQGQGRYRLLETVRQYARDRMMESGEGEAWRDRHLAYFLTLTEEAEPKLAGGPDQSIWLERMEAQHDNLRAALEWTTGRDAEAGLRLASMVWQFWHVRGYFAEGRSRVTALLGAADPGQRTVARSAALNVAGMLAYRQGDYAPARVLHEESLAIKRELSDPRGIALSLNNLANIFLEQGDPIGARDLYEQSLAIRRQLGDRRGIGSSLVNLGNVACLNDDYPTARALYEESLVIARELCDRWGIAFALGNLGIVSFESGDYASARELDEECIRIFCELRDRLGIAGSLEEFGFLAASVSDARRAAHLWGAAEQLREEIGSPLAPNERPRYEQQVTAARAALRDDAAFDAAWRQGRAMTSEQAIVYALEESDG
jgi:non-specific serine/threonine protein kinase